MMLGGGHNIFDIERKMVRNSFTQKKSETKNSKGTVIRREGVGGWVKKGKGSIVHNIVISLLGDM